MRAFRDRLQGGSPRLLFRLPERIQRVLVGIVPAHFGDAALLYPHELAAGDIQMPSLAGGSGMLHSDDELLPDRDIDQFSPERVPGQGPELGKKVIADSGPAMMVASNGARAWQVPDRAGGKARLCGLRSRAAKAA